MIKTYITSVLLVISLVFAAVTSARFIQDTDDRYVFLSWLIVLTPGPEAIKLFSFSAQLSIKFFLLIMLKCQQLLAF